jgi:hypothetical protein
MRSLHFTAILILLSIMVVSGTWAEPPRNRQGGVPALLEQLSDQVQALQEDIWDLQNQTGETSAARPVWQILNEETGEPVEWVDADNPRFAVYNRMVWDKETDLVWEQVPVDSTATWYDACRSCYFRTVSGDFRQGWRLPTAEELGSLVARYSMQIPALPAGHPFELPGLYFWSSTSVADELGDAYYLSLFSGTLYHHEKEDPVGVWCVRGGHGHDAY